MLLEASLPVYMSDLEGCSHKVPYYNLTFQWNQQLHTKKHQMYTNPCTHSLARETVYTTTRLINQHGRSHILYWPTYHSQSKLFSSSWTSNISGLTVLTIQVTPQPSWVHGVFFSLLVSDLKIKVNRSYTCTTKMQPEATEWMCVTEMAQFSLTHLALNVLDQQRTAACQNINDPISWLAN